MAIHDVTDLQYLVPRVVLWTLLFVVALFDALRHRHIKRRGNLLPWGILIVLAASMVQEILLLTYSLTDRAKNPRAADVRRSYFVFDDLEDALFMALLLAIAAGFCITRDNLGPHKQKIIVTPIVFFIAKATMNLILDFYPVDDSVESVPSDLDLWTFLIAYVADVVTLMAFMLAVVFVFEISGVEIESITHKEGIIGATRDLEAGRTPSATNANREQGYNVNLPPRATENGQALGDVYAEVTGNDADSPETVEDKLSSRTKITLMKQFRWAATVCVACYIVALVLPLFYYSAPGEEDTAVLVVLILWNAVRWCFLAGLCFIFRVRETNPYLLLDEMDNGLDTDFSSTEIRTELGVLVGAGSDLHPTSSDGINQNFSLDDEEDEQERKGSTRLVPPNRVKSNID